MNQQGEDRCQSCRAGASSTATARHVRLSLSVNPLEPVSFRLNASQDHCEVEIIYVNTCSKEQV